jgi:hypothetical protein
MADEVTVSVFDTSMIGIGMLGAVSPTAHGLEAAKEARLLMIERRILRAEMLLRRAGIEPESIELPR